MTFNSPDITTAKQHLESCIDAVRKHKLESHSAIKIQSLLNVTIYVMATRFFEGSVKLIISNCYVMQGDTQNLPELVDELKGFKNPQFVKTKELFVSKLNFDIISGKNKKKYNERDITFLNEIVINRHKNVHASSDSNEWYNQNKKDISNFQQEFEGMINILKYLDSIFYDATTNTFKD